MRQFSIRTLMAVILVSAVGLAALRNANEPWAGLMMLGALAAVGVAVLGAINLRGQERAWWQGFALFSGAYLVIALAPWFSPQLGTTQLLDNLREVMFPSVVQRLPGTEVESLSLQKQELEDVLAKMKQVTRNFNTDPAAMIFAKKLQMIEVKLTAAKNAGPLHENFQSVGHSLFALLAGLVGGVVAIWFYTRRDRCEAAVRSVD